MRNIEHILGIVSRGRHHLETPQPLRFADASRDRLRRDLNRPLTVKFLRCRNRQRQVAQLMTPHQRRLDHDLLAHHLQRIPLPLTARLRRLATGHWPLATDARHIRHGIHRARAHIQNCVSEHVVSFGQLRERNHNPTRPYDTRLFARNLGDRVAQILLMIERDVGDDAEPRLNHVGRVQTPAHSDLEHNHIWPAAGKILKGHRRQRLEKAGMPRQISFPNQPLRSPVDHVMEHREIVVADRFAIEANPLVNPNQMRRSIKPRLQPRSLQDGSESSGRRTLAVRACDQHRRKTILRMPQRREQHAHVRQIELVRRRLRQLVAQRVHLRHCGFVGQEKHSSFAVRYSPFARAETTQGSKPGRRFRLSLIGRRRIDIKALPTCANERRTVLGVFANDE